MSQKKNITPMNLYVRRGSPAEKAFHRRTGRPAATEIAKGIKPEPAHDLHFHGGKTIPQLHFMNLYVGGDAWPADDVANID